MSVCKCWVGTSGLRRAKAWEVGGMVSGRDSERGEGALRLGVAKTLA